MVMDGHDVAIIGEGTIDGNAMTTFAQWRPKQKLDKDLSRKMNHEEVARRTASSVRVTGCAHSSCNCTTVRA